MLMPSFFPVLVVFSVTNSATKMYKLYVFYSWCSLLFINLTQYVRLFLKLPESIQIAIKQEAYSMIARTVKGIVKLLLSCSWWTSKFIFAVNFSLAKKEGIVVVIENGRSERLNYLKLEAPDQKVISDGWANINGAKTNCRIAHN